MKNERKDLEQSAEDFFPATVLPALHEIKKIIAKNGMEAKIEQEKNCATVIAYLKGEEEFSYSISTTIYKPEKKIPRLCAIPSAGKWERHKKKDRGLPIKPGFYSIDDISEIDIVNDFRKRFRHRLKT